MLTFAGFFSFNWISYPFYSLLNHGGRFNFSLWWIYSFANFNYFIIFGVFFLDGSNLDYFLLLFIFCVAFYHFNFILKVILFVFSLFIVVVIILFIFLFRIRIFFLITTRVILIILCQFNIFEVSFHLRLILLLFVLFVNSKDGLIPQIVFIFPSHCLQLVLKAIKFSDISHLMASTWH